jgi:hypothetical protein
MTREEILKLIASLPDEFRAEIAEQLRDYLNDRERKESDRRARERRSGFVVVR